MTEEQVNPEGAYEIDPALQDALGKLQEQMALIDLLRKPAGKGMELLLKKHLLLALRMDGSRNHARAHLHVDYHRTKHLASYAIDNGDLLAGDGMYSSVVRPWIAAHRDDLMRVWSEIRGMGADMAVVAELRASAL